MKIVNLTPHEINIYRAGPAGFCHCLTIPPSGEVARIAVESKIAAYIEEANGKPLDPHDGFGGLPIIDSIFGEPSPLPPEEDGIIYIVSKLYRDARLERGDLFTPGELLRGENGQPYGCHGLRK